MLRQLSFALIIGVLAGCEMSAPIPEGPTAVQGGDRKAALSPDYVPLANLPRRTSPVTIAVYEIPDLTGANLRTEEFAEFSKAVTQGADALLVEALSEVGGGSWFRIVERKAVDVLLQERRLALAQIEDARQRAHAQSEANRIADEEEALHQEVAGYRSQLEQDYANTPADQMPPLIQALSDLDRFAQTRAAAIPRAASYDRYATPSALQDLTVADFILTGAIVAHESDVVSGGTGLRFQNIGLFHRTQKDVITVSLRLVRVRDGEIVANRTVSQTVLSRQAQGDALNYVTLNKVLELETGHVTNELRSFAVDAAFRLALSDILSAMENRWD